MHLVLQYQCIVVTNPGLVPSAWRAGWLAGCMGCTVQARLFHQYAMHATQWQCSCIHPLGTVLGSYPVCTPHAKKVPSQSQSQAASPGPPPHAGTMQNKSEYAGTEPVSKAPKLPTCYLPCYPANLPNANQTHH